MRGYKPVFLGQLPDDRITRWDRIRSFYSQWSRPQDSPLSDSFAGESKLIARAKGLVDGELSCSILQWFTLTENARVVDAPHIRDGETIIPIEDAIDDPQATNATVILESGESDVYWAVDNAALCDPDPPVKIFQRYDPSEPAYLGTNNSVSEFAIKYLAAYNEHAANNVEWFSADSGSRDLGDVLDWFQFCLEIKDDDRLFDRRFMLLESTDVAAIVNGDRIEVSVFCDPSTLGMPQFLVSKMDAHLKLRAEYSKR